MSGSHEEFSKQFPHGMTVEELQHKLDFWIHHGRHSTGQNREWTNGITAYLRNRIADARHANETEMERQMRQMRDRQEFPLRRGNHFRMRNLF